MTAFMVGTILFMVSSARTARWTPLVLIPVIAVLVWQGAPYTGTSLNPARSLAPALLFPQLNHLWVYLVGPLGGALVAVAIFGLVPEVETLTAKLYHDTTPVTPRRCGRRWWPHRLPTEPRRSRSVGGGRGSVPPVTLAAQWLPEDESRRAPGGVEGNGINVIRGDERKGTPRQLFFPWFAANVSVLGLTYGSFVLGFGISFWQAIVAGVGGVIASFLLCGFVAVAGKRGSAPTMVLSRAAFGVRGTKLPALVSWMLCVGWETVLTYLAIQATSTVLLRLGWGGGNGIKAAAFVVVAVLVVGAGVLGFDVIMRMQGAITVLTAVLTVMFVWLTASKIHWPAVSQIRAGSTQEVIGALVFVMSALGLGWINSAADYSRYLPRRVSTGGVIGWTAFGASAGPVLLIVMGLLLAGSSKSLNSAISGSDPIGALSALLPTWFLGPFVVVAVLGLIGGAVLDIYSSGLALLTVGLRTPRYVAAGIDGLLMVAGAVYLVFFAHGFVPKFEGFLTTLAVPISAFGGIMLADVFLRRRPYNDGDLYHPGGRYGDVRYLSVGLMVAGTFLGWGTVTNTAWGRVLGWQGYLLGPIGLGGKAGPWAHANLGVVFALGLGFVGWLLLGAFAVRAQEAYDAPNGLIERARRLTVR